MNKNTNVKDCIVNRASAKIEVIKLGLDVHASQVTVAVQWDGCPVQPAQKIGSEVFMSWIEALQQRHPGVKLYSCYEAGPCGYWLHRKLAELGVTNYVVAPVALNGRRKTDPRDARALCEQLDRYVRGHRRAFSPVAVPRPAQEQERALVRHRQRLLQTLGRCAQQGRSLALLQGLRMRGKWWTPRAWAQWQAVLPAWLAALLSDLQAQAQLVHAQLRAADEQIAALGRAKELHPPHGIGVLTWLTLLLEVIDWRRFTNRRQVASYTGLCPGEDSSGERRRELSIDKHGNRRVRRMLIEAAWRLGRWQPQYPPLDRLRAARGRRAAKRAIVAVARRLAIDLWRLATGQTTAEKIGLAAVPRALRPAG